MMRWFKYLWHQIRKINLGMPHPSLRSTLHSYGIFYPVGIAIPTSYSISRKSTLDIFLAWESACRRFQTGFITTSSIASAQDDQTFQPRRLSNEAMVFAATLLIALSHFAE